MCDLGMETNWIFSQKNINKVALKVTEKIILDWKLNFHVNKYVVIIGSELLKEHSTIALPVDVDLGSAKQTRSISIAMIFWHV